MSRLRRPLVLSCLPLSLLPVSLSLLTISWWIPVLLLVPACLSLQVLAALSLALRSSSVGLGKALPYFNVGSTMLWTRGLVLSDVVRVLVGEGARRLRGIHLRLHPALNH